MCLAIPGRITEIIEGDGLERRARIDVAGVVKGVSLGLVPEARVGDHIVSHSGFALRVVHRPVPGGTAESSAHDSGCREDTVHNIESAGELPGRQFA